MSILALSAALGASFSWALGSIMAHGPANRLGAFEFTRTQLISSAALLLFVVTAVDGWTSVTWTHWREFGMSSFAVIFSNLAMAACLRRGGPRRTQLLLAMNAPIAASLGYVVLGETISLWKAAGALLILSGVILAVLCTHEDDDNFEPTTGNLAPIVAFGLLSAICSAIGLIVLKPALLAGTQPLAASALRTGGAAFAMAVIALWPAKIFEPVSKRTGSLVLRTILPGILGYVLAVTLLLYALRIYGVGIAAVLGSTSPVMILPMIWATTGQRPAPQAWLGACILVVGTGFILVG